MEWFKTDDEGSGRMTSIVCPSFSSFEHTDEQSDPIQEEYYNLFDGKGILLVSNPFCGNVEVVFKSPMYNEDEDNCSKDEGLKWDISSYSSSTDYLCQEERSSPETIENISYELQEEEQGEVSGIRDEATEVAGKEGHKLPSHNHFERPLNSLQGKTQLEQ